MAVLPVESRVGRNLVVSLERQPRKLADGTVILPFSEFVKQLFGGLII